MQTRWIFFDVGDVLFDENAQHRYIFHSMFLAARRNSVNVTWDAYFDQLRQAARSKPSTAFTDALHTFVPDAALYDKIKAEGMAEYRAMRLPRPFGMLLDDMMPVLEDLRKDFRLGVIANQHPPIVDALRDYGLEPLFDVIAIDEIVGFTKPDSRIFEWAFAKAGCAPREAIMVGDRPDNDVAPAKKLGMGTIRFKRGELYVYYDPLTDDERADIVVTDIARLASAVRKLAVLRAAL